MIRNKVLSVMIICALLSLVALNKKADASKIVNKCVIAVIANIDNKNIGDKNSSLGIAKALIKEFSMADCPQPQVEILTINDEDKLSSLMTNNNKVVILTAGSYGIEFLRSFSKAKNTLLVWSGHQYFDALESIASKVDFVILPIYVTNKSITDFFQRNNTALISASGVANNIDLSNLPREDNKDPWMDNNAANLIVFVGGDAPDEQGKLKEMSKKDFFQFGKSTAMLAKKSNLIILATNSPRTTKEQYLEFEKGLISEGYNNAKYKLYDYHFGERVYLQLLNKIKTFGSDAIISGESSSMVRDVIENTNKKIYVYYSGSMNESHKKQIDYEFLEGRVEKIQGKSFSHNKNPYIVPVAVSKFVADNIKVNPLWVSFQTR